MMIRSFAAAVLCCAAAGCATTDRMVVDKNATTLDTTEKSIVLLALEVSRTDANPFIPVPSYIHFEARHSGMENVDVRFVKKQHAVEDNGKTIYLARMTMAPGEYKLEKISGTARSMKLIATFKVPLAIDVKVKPQSISYVGRLSATLRPRVKGEFPAGAGLPLQDQREAGMLANTWEISMADNAERDLALFREHYPALKGANIQTNGVLKFDRDSAHSQWRFGRANKRKGDAPEDEADKGAAP